MKIGKKLLTTILTVTLLLTSSIGSFAAEEQGTVTKEGYKVTIYTGVKGTVEGKDKIQLNVKADGTVDPFSINQVSLNLDENGNSKYYAKGFRISGREDASLLNSISNTAKFGEDTDYVVVYGIKGQQVAYTVRYVDRAGKELAAADTFYGNIGDKPVVSCKYIEGYAPQAFGLTGTLVENPNNDATLNVFTFVYVPSEINYYSSSTEYVDGGTNIIYTDGGTTVIAGGTTATGGGATNVTGGGAVAGEDTENAGEGTIVAEEDENVPQQIIDLDDEEVPLANVDLDELKEEAPFAGTIAIACISLAALIALAIFLISRKRNTGVEE